MGAAAQAVLLTAFGLILQFVVRLTMTARLGAGVEYDAFLVAMMPAVLMAQVGFQAVASALVPRVAAVSAEGQPQRARSLALMATAATMLFWGGVAVLAWGWSHFFFPVSHPYGSGFPGLLLTVMVAWGLLGGWAILQRQFLVFFGQYGFAVLVGYLPALTMAALAFWPQATLHHFVWAGVAGQLLSNGLLSLLLWRAWGRHTASQGQLAIPVRRELAALGLAALPILLASFNAQAMSLIDQAMAAWWQLGGLTLLSVALTVSRLPHTLAENLMLAAGYRHLVDAASRLTLAPAEARRHMGGTVTSLLRAQAMVVWPAAVGIVVAHQPIVEVLYQRGKFDASDATRAAAILLCYPLCSPWLVVQSVQVQALVVLGKATVALRYELVLTILSAALNLALLPIMGLPGLVVSTALSTAVVAWLVAGALQRLEVGVTRLHYVQALWAPTLAAGAALIAAHGAAIFWRPTGSAWLQLAFAAAVVAPVFYGVEALARRLRPGVAGPTPTMSQPNHREDS